MSTLSMEVVLPNNRKFAPFLLASFSICGCVLGVAVASSADPYLISMMRQAVCAPVSIVDLLFVILFPFVITAVISYISKPILLLPVCFLKTLGYSFMIYAICKEFSGAGWLVAGLLLHSDTVCMITLYFFCLCYLTGFNQNGKRDIVVATIITSAISLLDVCLVSPFLTALI